MSSVIFAILPVLVLTLPGVVSECEPSMLVEEIQCRAEWKSALDGTARALDPEADQCLRLCPGNRVRCTEPGRILLSGKGRASSIEISEMGTWCSVPHTPKGPTDSLSAERGAQLEEQFEIGGIARGSSGPLWWPESDLPVSVQLLKIRWDPPDHAKSLVIRVSNPDDPKDGVELEVPSAAGKLKDPIIDEFLGRARDRRHPVMLSIWDPLKKQTLSRVRVLLMSVPEENELLDALSEVDAHRVDQHCARLYERSRVLAMKHLWAEALDEFDQPSLRNSRVIEIQRDRISEKLRSARPE